MAPFLSVHFFKLEFSRGFLLYILGINFAVRAGDIIFFRVPRSSLRMRRSSVGCSVVQKGAAKFSKVHRISEGCNLAQRVQRSS
jgi:hypothetical protein